MKKNTIVWASAALGLTIITTVTLLKISITGKQSEDLSIKTLEISNSKNVEKLSKIGQFKGLEKLTIVCLEELLEIPEEIGQLKDLKELNMDNGNGCSMNAQLPDSIGQLGELKLLNLAGAQDSRPNGNKKIKDPVQLPQSLSKLNKLETLDLSRNGFLEIPMVVSKVPNLKRLILNFNSIESLPDWLANSSIIEVSLRNNCKISGSHKKQEELSKKFPKIHFDFSNDFDCE